MKTLIKAFRDAGGVDPPPGVSSAALWHAAEPGSTAKSIYWRWTRKPLEILHQNGLAKPQPASEADSLACVELLLSLGADVNYRDPGALERPMLKAFRAGHVTVAKALLSRQADTPVQLPTSILVATPLWYAVRLSDMGLVQGLLDRAYIRELERRNGAGWCSITRAAVQAGQVDIARLLFQYRDKGQCSQDTMQDLVNAAASSGSLETLKLVLESGGDVKLADYDGFSALHMASSAEVATFLLQQGIPVDVPRKLASLPPQEQKMTPLMACCEDGRGGAIQVLVDAGADITVLNRLGASTLLAAARSGLSDAVRLLVSRGVSVNQAIEDHGHTPLRAALHNRVEVVRVLLELGADTKPPAKHGQWVLEFASSYSEESLRILIEQGEDINSIGPNGNTLMHKVAVSERSRYDPDRRLNVLIGLGGDLEAKDSQGASALHTAAGEASSTTMQAFLDLGAYIESRDDNGWTPLMKASQRQEVFPVVLLLEHGADLELDLFPDSRIFG